MPRLEYVVFDTEIMDLYEYLTGQKKEGLFNFRSKNIIKKDTFKKFLQKLVDRLIDLKGYCKKYGINPYYDDYYFYELLYLFNAIIEKNKELEIHIDNLDILYDIKRNISIKCFNILNKSYEYYVEEFKKFIRRKEYPYEINPREFKSLFESFIKSLSNKSNPTNIVFIDNLHLPGNTPPNYKIFIEKYNKYIYCIGIVKKLINQVKKRPNSENNNTLNKLNKDIEKNIEQLKRNIELLNQKLEEQIKANVNNQKRRNENRKRISIEAEEAERAERARRNKPPVRNWTSMYYRGNERTAPDKLPTDPEEIEKAKKRFERILKKEGLKQIANSCYSGNFRNQYTITPDQYTKCRKAKIEFNKMEEENSPRYQRKLEKNRLKKIAEQCSNNNHTYTDEQKKICTNSKKKLQNMNHENYKLAEQEARHI